MYLRGIIVLFTYSIILTGVVGGDFKFLITDSSGLIFLIFVLLGLTLFGFRSIDVFSHDDEVYYFYGRFFVILSAIILVSILFYCIIELVEDYV